MHVERILPTIRLQLYHAKAETERDRPNLISSAALQLYHAKAETSLHR